MIRSAGRYASVFKGRGMDFDRVRNYVPGDDVRTIDWNVTARTGHPHVKLFTEERELTILLMIDVSASSDFGSVVDSKRELAAEAAGVLAASAIRNRDKVGLILFSDEVELYIPPGQGPHAYHAPDPRNPVFPTRAKWHGYRQSAGFRQSGGAPEIRHFPGLGLLPRRAL